MIIQKDDKDEEQCVCNLEFDVPTEDDDVYKAQQEKMNQEMVVINKIQDSAERGQALIKLMGTKEYKDWFKKFGEKLAKIKEEIYDNN